MSRTLETESLEDLVKEINRRGYSCRVHKKRGKTDLTPTEKKLYNGLTTKWQTKPQIQEKHPEIKNGGFYSFMGLLINKDLIEKRYDNQPHYGQMWRKKNVE
jgi:predicted DNA-binding ArsR family transcriptional regulator